MVDHSGRFGVKLAPAQVFGRDYLSSRCFDQLRRYKESAMRDLIRRKPIHAHRRPSQENGSLIPNNDALVRHCRHVRSAGGTAAEHNGYLRDAHRGHVGLVVKDAAKVVAVREDVGLPRKIGATRVDCDAK